MKQIITLLCILISITGFAQETCSRIIDKAVPVDTAKFNVTYTLNINRIPTYRITMMTSGLCR